MLKKLASETAVYGISSILGRLLNYIVMTPYLTRVLTKSEFGTVSEMFVYASFFTVLYTYRIQVSYFRYGKNEADRPTAFWTAAISVLGSSTFLFSLVLLLGAWIAQLLEYPTHPEYIYLLGSILLLDGLAQIPLAELRLSEKSFQFAAISILNIVVNIAVILFLFQILPNTSLANHFAGSWLLDPEYKISFVLLANALASLTTLLLLLPNYFKYKLQFDRPLLRKMLIYCLPLLVAALAGSINETLGRYLLKVLLPGTLAERTADLGVYSACYKLAMLMTMFTQAYNFAAEPFFFRQSAQSTSRDIYAKAATAFLIVGCLLFLGISLYLDVIKYVIDESYFAGLPIVPVILVANIFLGIYYNLAVWFKMTDKTHFGTIIGIFGAIITILLNFALIPTFGYYGSAWGTLLCYFSMCVMCYYYGQQYFPIPYPITKMATHLITAISLYLISELLRQAFALPIVPTLCINTFLLSLYAVAIFFLELKSKEGLLHSIYNKKAPSA